MEEKQVRNYHFIRRASSSYSLMGFALLIMFGSATLFSSLISGAVSIFCPSLMQNGWFLWALSVVPLYLLGFPLSMIFFLQIDPVNVPKNRLKITLLLKLLPVCVFWMYTGSFMGEIISRIFSFTGNGTAQNIVDRMLTSSDITVNVAVTVLIVPMMEELVARKLIIDRIRQFGESHAMMFSALMFGLMHGNFQQFFYAFFLGLIFAWVYIKTGRIIYSVLLHATVNLLGGIIPIVLNSGMDLTELLGGNLLEPGIFGATTLSMIFNLCMVVLSVIGLILTVINTKRLLLKRKQEVFTGVTGSAVYLNPGVILFIVYSLFVFLFSLLF